MQLFPKQIIPLIFLHAGTNFFRKLRTYPCYFRFIYQNLTKQCKTFLQIRLSQYLLFFRICQRNVSGNFIYQPFQIVQLLYSGRQIFTNLGITFGISFKNSTYLTQSRLILQFRKHFRLRHIRRFYFNVFRYVFRETANSCSLSSLYKNPYDSTRQLRQLPNAYYRANLVYVLKSRILCIDIFLRHNQKLLVSLHRLFHRLNGFGSAQVKMYNHIRQNRHSAQCYRRNPILHLFLFHLFPPSADMDIRGCRKMPIFFTAFATTPSSFGIPSLFTGTRA